MAARAGAVLIVGLGTFIWRPALAGYAALVAWTGLLAMPALPSILFTRAVQRGQHRAAAQWADWLARWDDRPQTRIAAERFRAFADFQEGRLEAGKHRLRALADDLHSQLLLLRLDGAWDEILSRTRPHLVEEDGPNVAQLACAIYALRAYGELGAIDENWPALFRRARTLAPREPSMSLFLCAFGGRPDLVSLVERTHRPPLASEVVAFWHATARQVAGEDTKGLETLADTGSPLVKLAARQRLAHPFSQPASVLLPLIKELETELRDKERYGAMMRSSDRRAPVTWAAASLIILAHGAAEIAGIPLEVRFGTFGLITPDTEVAGEWWRVWTAALVHAGWLHALFNAWALWVFGRYVERLIGSFRLAFGLVGTLVCTKSLILALDTLLSTDVRGYVGASDGVMGLVGMALALLFIAFRRGSRVARRQIVGVAVVVLAQTAFDLTHPQISFKAHALGLLLGIAYGTAIGLLSDEGAH